MIEKKYSTDLNSLLEIAHSQGDKLNLSTIMITIKCSSEELQDILGFFSDEGIEIINEDVEPDFEQIGNVDHEISPFDPSKIDIKMDRIPIESIIKRIKYEELEFDSSFQRKAGLWKIKQKSRLIESILLRIPLPAFYFDASNDDKWQIIDGLQRITAIKEYVIENGFKLSDMEFLNDLDDKLFCELPRALQRRIEETNLNAYLVSPSTPKNVKFNIFKRINTGGLVLEPQEIRNALFQGKASVFLYELAQTSEFINATDHSIKPDRMLDREFCLRYISITRLDINQYNGNLDDFLNSGMEYLEHASEYDLKEIKHTFASTMKKCLNLFDKFAFRRMNREGRRGPVNKSIFEIWSKIIEDLIDSDYKILLQKKNILLKKFIILCDNPVFRNAIKASDKNSVKNRIKLVEDMIDSIIGGDDD